MGRLLFPFKFLNFAIQKPPHKLCVKLGRNRGMMFFFIIRSTKGLYLDETYVLLSAVMKKNKIVQLGFFILFLSLGGCAKKFGDLTSQAQRSFDQKLYVETVDAINLALPRWEESDGQEKKAQAYQLLGKAYHQLKKMDQAIEAYREAVQLSSQTYDSAYTLALIYLGTSQLQKAKNYFEDALRMKPDDPLALVGWGDCLYLAKDYKNAKVIYNKVLEVSPGVSTAIYNLRLIEQISKRRVTPVKINPARLKKNHPIEKLKNRR